MDFISLLAVKAPHDLWTIIIDWIHGAGINFGWTILLFTLLVKLATSPLDFMVKYTTKKQTLVQKKCAPQVAKLQKKFGSDQQTLRTQTNALYKREGLNMGAGCIVMLVNMILTCTIFFSLYGTLREVSAYQAIKQYETIESTYTSTLHSSLINELDNDEIVDEATAITWIQEFEAAQKIVDETDEQDIPTTEGYAEAKALYDARIELATKAVTKAKETIVPTWNKVKESWLWVDNIWVADATTHPFPTYSGLKTLADNGGNYYKNYVKKNIDKDTYSTISSIISKETNREYNGYYILAVLAGVVTFASQWIADLHNKLKNKKANLLAESSGDATGKSMKMMKFVMPIVMVMFVISTGASFGVYLLASNIASIALGEIITVIINALTKKQRQEVEEVLAKEADRLIKKGKLQG